MNKSLKSKAEKQFAAVQTQAKQAQRDKERAQRELVEKMTRLRDLRLAAEAAQKDADEKIALTKAAKKAKTP